jgi:phospholipase/carboxylesterase
MLDCELVKAAAADSRDLLITLHGLGASREQFRSLPQVFRFPRLNVLLVDAPDAYYGGFSWYDFADNPGPGVERSYRLLSGLLDEWRGKGYPTDRTMLFGFSQGCLMSYETGVRYPHLFAGLIGVSGYVHEPERLLKLRSPVAGQQRFLVTHGTDDALIPLDQVRLQVEQMRAGGVNIDFREYHKDHTIIDEEVALFRSFVSARLGYH